MKQTTNMQRSIQYLNKIFKALNEEYFENELPTPIITIQSTPKAYSHRISVQFYTCSIPVFLLFVPLLAICFISAINKT